MAEDWRVQWNQIIDCCRRIQHYTRGLDPARLADHDMALDAVLHNLERIQAIAGNLPEEAGVRLSDLQWHHISGFATVTRETIHGRPSEALWEVLERQVPSLLEEMERVDQSRQPLGEIPRRGREARHPQQIPWRGWRDILLRVLGQLRANDILIVSAGVAFYAVLAVFPALASVVVGYGLLLDPAEAAQRLDIVGMALPSQAWQMIRQQLLELASASKTDLGIGAAVGLLLTLWTARAGISGLIRGLDIVYGESETRRLLHFQITALLLTLGAILFSVVSLATLVILPGVLEVFNMAELVRWVVTILRWPLLVLVVMLALTVIYRYGPSRRPARWEWVSLGAVVATLLWMIGSALFSLYVSRFGAYDETYGPSAALIVLMLWFWLTAFAALLGAQLNAETERQTRQDTTDTPDRPMGQRGAFVADTLGRRP